MFEDIFTTVLNMSITASVAAILIFFFRWLLDKKSPKSYVHILWFIVLIRMLIPFSLPSTFSIFNVLPMYQTLVNQNSQQYIIDQNIQYSTDYQSISHEKTNNIDYRTSSNNNTDYNNFTISNELSRDSKILFEYIAARVWLTGFIALLLLSIFLFFYTSNKLKMAILYNNNNLIYESCQKLRLNRKVRIYLSDKIDTPVVCGIIKPCIILPSFLEQNCNKSELQYVIEHELIHIKRVDYIVKPLWVLSLCIHWFNPILWLSFIFFQKDMELSCDEIVLKANGNDIRNEYATLLIKLASKQNTLINGKLLAFGESNIKNRIKKIMSFRKPLFLFNILAIICIIILGFTLLSNGQHNLIDTKNNTIKADEYNKLQTVISRYYAETQPKNNGTLKIYNIEKYCTYYLVLTERYSGEGERYSILFLIDNKFNIMAKSPGDIPKSPCFSANVVKYQDKSIIYGNFKNKKWEPKTDRVVDVQIDKIKIIFEDGTKLEKLVSMDKGYIIIANTQSKIKNIEVYNNKGELQSDLINESTYSEQSFKKVLDTFDILNHSNIYNVNILLKYKNKYVGNASNVSNLIYNLPYANLYKGISLKTEKPPYGININYNFSTIDVDMKKFENTLLNNAVIMFALIDNVDIINFKLKIDKDYKNYEYSRKEIQKGFDKDLREYAKDINNFKTLVNNLNNNLNNTSASSEKYRNVEPQKVVEQFGQKLKFVNKLAPEKELKEEIKKYYSQYLSSSLLTKWLKDPKKALGRYVSSPWPDRIEVNKITKINNKRYILEGDIIEITNIPNEEKKTKVRVTVEKFDKLGWLINDLTLTKQNEQFQESVNITKIKVVLGENSTIRNGTKPIYISDSKMINDIMSMIENSKPLVDTSIINKLNKGTEYDYKITVEYKNSKKREINIIYDYLYEIGYIEENGKKTEPNYNFFRYISSLYEYPNPDTNIEQQVLNLFKKYNWTIDFKINTLKINLPNNLKHKAGEYPIKIYWAYNNELSKQINLDISSYLGKSVNVEIYRLREPLPDFMKPRRDARGIVVKYNNKIIGAFIDAGRHDSFACSLNRKSLQEITQKDWVEWIDNYIDYNDEIEKKLLKMKPEEIIKEYINALDRHDYKMIWACSTRKSLTQLLSTNMDNRYLYNDERQIDYNIKKAKLIKIEKLKGFSDKTGIIEYQAQIYFDFNKIITDNDGICTRFIVLTKDTDKTGWKVDGIGTGP